MVARTVSPAWPMGGQADNRKGVSVVQHADDPGDGSRVSPNHHADYGSGASTAGDSPKALTGCAVSLSARPVECKLSLLFDEEEGRFFVSVGERWFGSSWSPTRVVYFDNWSSASGALMCWMTGYLDGGSVEWEPGVFSPSGGPI